MVRPAAALVVACMACMACALAAPTVASAGQRTPAREPVRGPAAAPAAPFSAEQPGSTQAARQTREDLQRVLEQYPPSLGHVLRLDPTLLDNPDYLQPYPALGAFVAQHPEIAHNPAYFFDRYGEQTSRPLDPQDRAFSMWNKVLEGFMVILVFGSIFSLVIWLIRTGIDHRRWARLTKVQTDVHGKLLDRFTSNEDLLAYIQTPAGRRFLESTPIAIDSPRSLGAPLGRILWSMQIGAVLTVAGIGIEIVAARAIAEVAQPVSAIGVVVIAVGIGFAISAALAYAMSRRLGLLDTPATAEPRA